MWSFAVLNNYSWPPNLFWRSTHQNISNTLIIIWRVIMTSRSATVSDALMYCKRVIFFASTSQWMWHCVTWPVNLNLKWRILFWRRGRWNINIEMKWNSNNCDNHSWQKTNKSKYNLPEILKNKILQQLYPTRILRILNGQYFTIIVAYVVLHHWVTTLKKIKILEILFCFCFVIFFFKNL